MGEISSHKGFTCPSADAADYPSGNNQVNLDFTNTNNTFTGNVVGPAGNANGADYFRFASIGDGGNFTFNKAGNRGGVTYIGSTNITFGTRQIVLGTSFGGGGVTGTMATVFRKTRPRTTAPPARWLTPRAGFFWKTWRLS